MSAVSGETWTPFASAFIDAAAAAWSERSLATTLDAPASAAAIPTTTLPEPTSTTRRPRNELGWRII